MEKHIVFIAEIRFKMVGTMLESKKHEEKGNNNEGTVDVKVVNMKSEVPHDHQPSLDNQVSSTFYSFVGSLHLGLCIYHFIQTLFCRLVRAPTSLWWMATRGPLKLELQLWAQAP